jgi:hypothetical protein
MQQCTRCKETKPLEAFRRHPRRKCGRDSICKACRKARYDKVKEESFGPLPGRAGSNEWLAEVERRARVIATERHPNG